MFICYAAVDNYTHTEKEFAEHHLHYYESKWDVCNIFFCKHKDSGVFYEICLLQDVLCFLLSVFVFMIMIIIEY